MSFEPTLLARIAKPNSAKLEGYRAAGKTGTAQKPIPGKGYVPGKYVASFAGFVPVSNPQLAIVVVVDEPKGGLYYGAEVAAPAFKHIAEQVLHSRAVAPDQPLLADGRAIHDRPGRRCRERHTSEHARVEPGKGAARPQDVGRGGDDAGRVACEIIDLASSQRCRTSCLSSGLPARSQTGNSATRLSSRVRWAQSISTTCWGGWC